MKRLFYVVIALFITTSAFAQTPEKVSYQAVIRDAEGVLVIDKELDITLSILQGSDLGTAIYVETHSTQTNANGLVSLTIGSGVALGAQFGSIDWETGPYFIKTETAIDGESLTSIAELLSVPFALYAKNTSKVNGFRVATEVPEGALFTDDQSASEVLVNALNTLEAETVQEALEQLQQMLEETGDMKKTAYDNNKDGVVDNTTTVNGLRVLSQVPSEATFTDNQTGVDVGLSTALDIDGDGTPESTVEAALIELNKLLKKLQDDAKASTGGRILASSTEASSGIHRPCLATHYDPTHDLVSFITGTEIGPEIKGRILGEEPIYNHCHYIYGEKSFSTISYKILETEFLEKTEHADQAISTSFMVEPSESKSIDFTQPLLCRDSATMKWGYEQTREDKKFCVFGVSFATGEGTSVLDRGVGLDYTLYSLNTTAVDGNDYKCGQVNPRIPGHPGTVFFGGQYNPSNGTCRIVPGVQEKILSENFFVYSDVPVENYIYEALGSFYLDEQVYGQFQSSPHSLIDKFTFNQGFNIVSPSYKSMEYVADIQCYDDNQRYFKSTCDTDDNTKPVYVLNSLQRLSMTKVANRSDNPSFSNTGKIMDAKGLAIKLSVYPLAENETSKEEMTTYVKDLKELIGHSKTLRDLYLGALLVNDQININHKAMVIKESSKGHYHDDVLESGFGFGSGTMTELVTVEEVVEDLVITEGAEGIPIFVNSNGKEQNQQINKYRKELIETQIEKLEKLSTSANFLPLEEETHFHTDLNSVHRFIRERLEIDPNAFPSYFQHNHPELILNGAQLDAQDRVAIMMADLSYQCPDILKDWDAEAIDLTKPGRISQCMHNDQEIEPAPGKKGKYGGNAPNFEGMRGGNNSGGQGGQGGDGNNNQGDDNNNNPNQNLQQFEGMEAVNVDLLTRFLNYILKAHNGSLPNDFNDFTDRLMRGLNLPAEGNARAGFGDHHLTLEELQAVLRGLVNLDGNQRGNMANAIANAGLEHDPNQESAQNFLNMLRNNLPHGELTIQVLEGQGHDNVVHEHQQDHEFGLGNIQNVESIGQNRLFISGDDNRGLIYIYPDGKRKMYHGESKDGKPNGQGTMTFKNGNVYEGAWEDGKRHGQGKYTYVYGGVYEGAWEYGERHGEGKATFENGVLYEGQ